MEIDRKLQKKDKKRKMLIEQQRLKKEDVEEEEELNNEDIRVEKTLTKKAPSVKFAQEDQEMSDDEDDGGLFVNPLLMKNGTVSGVKSKKAGG